MIAPVPGHRPVVGIPHHLERGYHHVPTGVGEPTDAHFGVFREPCFFGRECAVRFPDGREDDLWIRLRGQRQAVAHAHPSRGEGAARIGVIGDPVAGRDHEIGGIGIAGDLLFRRERHLLGADPSKSLFGKDIHIPAAAGVMEDRHRTADPDEIHVPDIPTGLSILHEADLLGGH